MDYIHLNREAWNERTKVHVNSTFYDVEGFLNGQSSLKEIELSEVGDVCGKKLLHLQCHFGMDTLSWARQGAQVTGVDLSSESIRFANDLKQKASLDAEFICSDVYEFEHQTSTIYDIVYVSYGALNWLPDINRWARVVARSLKPGGHLHLIEFHPVFDLFSGDPYFDSQDPIITEEGTYTENCEGSMSKMVTWSRSIGDVVNALISQGMTMNHLHEFPFSPHNCSEDFEEKEKGRYYWKNTKYPIPITYSIKATKSESV